MDVWNDCGKVDATLETSCIYIFETAWKINILHAVGKCVSPHEIYYLFHFSIIYWAWIQRTAFLVIFFLPKLIIFKICASE